MNKSRKEYTVLWLIENYSYCWHKNEEALISPEFTGDLLEGTIWYLDLYPRGFSHEGWVSLFLNRNAIDDGSEVFPLKYELSILAADGSTLKSDECLCLFSKDDADGHSYFVEINEVLLRKKDYLPQDTLRVCCRMWFGEGDIQQVKQITARTRIGIEQVSFRLAVENFISLKPNQKKTVQIPSLSNNDIVSSSASIVYCDSDCEGKIMLEFEPSDTDKVLSECKIFLLNSSETAIEFGKADYRFDAMRGKICKIPLSITKQEITGKGSEYLQGDKLSLLIECIFSVGVEFDKVEKVIHEVPFVATNQISNTDHDKNILAEKSSKCHSALDDLKEIFRNHFLTDVEIKTKTKSFPAHKILLCARSPVFKSMLTNDMKEKITNGIQIDDLEDDIVQQFLLFLYSDNVENLAWDSATKLYYAGDKYQVEKLKVICASYLADNLSMSNASKALLLADTHNDSDLKKTVEKFIFKHEEQVYGSEEWGNLMETNPLLVSRTMCLKYMRKR